MMVSWIYSALTCWIEKMKSGDTKMRFFYGKGKINHLDLTNTKTTYQGANYCKVSIGNAKGEPKSLSEKIVQGPKNENESTAIL